MRRPVLKAILCLWATTLAVAALFAIRGCAADPVLTVRVELPVLEFVER